MYEGTIPNDQYSFFNALSKSTWGGHRQTILTIYHALIRSQFNYAGPSISSLTKTHLSTLDKIQYPAVHIALGAMPSAPANALLVEAVERPLKLRFEWIVTKFLAKQLQLLNNLLILKLELLQLLTDRVHRYTILLY